MLNLTLIFNYIVPNLFASTIFGIFISVAIGLVVGLIIGAIKHRINKTMIPAILGSFFGTMLICMMPTYSVPGLVQSWGKGGGLGSLPVLFMMVSLAPIGGILGAVVGSTYKQKFFQTLTSQKLLIMLIATYTLMAVCIYASFSLSCAKPTVSQWYCTEVGF
ncbi:MULTISPECIES: hypothetical protein [Nostocales]|uniref:Uncharacterized protein n=3 Tax=Nostocales TaxID=1161 RepID=A0A0C1QN52_9CYAN|nr:hypothetical protein [Tolypothrix bouteillei]KAF3889654.1 hypothetical protein DA73_0400032420 [Tolypothrix bouteillei VB521301]